MGKYKQENGTTRIGDWLRKSAPHILDVVGEVLPENGALGIVKNLISNDSKLTPKQKEDALGVLKLDLEDIKDARSMYKSTDHEMADLIASRVIKYNLWVVGIMVVIEIFAVIFIDDKVLIAIISGAIGSVTTALLQERQQIINFFFGSSRGSKAKSRRLDNV